MKENKKEDYDMKLLNLLFEQLQMKMKTKMMKRILPQKTEQNRASFNIFIALNAPQQTHLLLRYPSTLPQFSLNTSCFFELRPTNSFTSNHITMGLDDPEDVQRFVSRMNGQHEPSNLNTLTIITQTANEYGQIVEHDKFDDAKTPPHTPVAHGENRHLTSPEAHPKPSPHLSGLQAPNNTPKTAASSPRLTAMNTHNQDVSEAFSEYMNTVNSRPLSESMWAPTSTRYKPSMLGGARSTKVLTPVKSVEPNPAINDTFDRMSFKAADSAGLNLIGDSVTQTLFTKAPPSFINQMSILTSKIQQGKVRGEFTHEKLENASSDAFEPPTYNESAEHDHKIQKTPIKTKSADKEDLPSAIDTDRIGKEKVVPPTPKSDVPPHLQATAIGKENVAPPTAKSNVPPHLQATVDPPQKSIKVKTNPSCAEDIDQDAMDKISKTSMLKDAVRAATMGGVEIKVISEPAGTKPTKSLTNPSSSEDLEHKTYFGAWPKSEARTQPGKIAANFLSVPIFANAQQSRPDPQGHHQRPPA